MAQHARKAVQVMAPHNIEAEEGLLGLLLQWKGVTLISDYLRPEHFYREFHRQIYTAMVDLDQEGHPTDFITVSTELKRKGVEIEDELGGTKFLLKLESRVSERTLNSDNIESYAQIIVEEYINRQTMDAIAKVAALIGNEPPNVVIEKAQQMFFTLNQEGVQGGFQPVSGSMPEYMERVASMKDQGGVMAGIPSGFPGIDKLLRGFRNGKFYILAARPGVGKTSLALAFAYYAAVKLGLRIGVLSLEMDKMELIDRLVAIDGKLDAMRIGCGDLSDEEYAQFIVSAEVINRAPLFIDDGVSCSPSALRSKALRLQSEYGLDMLIVDYLQLMDGDTSESSDNEVRMLTAISRRLKMLSRELDIPVIALAQLSRKVEDRQSKIPQLADLRGSGTLEQDADVVMFIYRDEMYNPDTERKKQADVLVAKHRGGPVGSEVLGFEGSQTRFFNIELHSEERYGIA